jgi:indolepyruvate ferredoxin oxidoreductase alpha subunit
MESVERGLIAITIKDDGVKDQVWLGEISHQREPISGGFCAGCPHRASLYTLRQAVDLLPFDVTVLGDIGCYTQGIGSTGYNVLQTVFCMGASVGLASSIGRFAWSEKKGKILSVAGDSTFFHSCIPGLIEIQQRQSPVVVVILDNFVSAMTGGQQTPETPAFNGFSSGTSPVLIESILRGIGLPFSVLDPFDFDNNINVICQLLERGGPHVVVFRSPCALYKKQLPGQPAATMQINYDICVGEACGCNMYCHQVFMCPAIKISEDAKRPSIDAALCNGCGACQKICPAGAILPVTG